MLPLLAFLWLQLNCFVVNVDLTTYAIGKLAEALVFAAGRDDAANFVVLRLHTSACMCVRACTWAGRLLRMHDVVFLLEMERESESERERRGGGGGSGGGGGGGRGASPSLMLMSLL